MAKKNTAQLDTLKSIYAKNIETDSTKKLDKISQKKSETNDAAQIDILKKQVKAVQDEKNLNFTALEIWWSYLIDKKVKIRNERKRKRAECVSNSGSN